MSGALRRLSMGLRTASIPTRNRTVEWAKEWADTDEATKEAVQVAGIKLRASGMVRMHLGDDCIRGAAYIAGLRPVAWGPSYPQGTLAPSPSFPQPRFAIPFLRADFLPGPFSPCLPPAPRPHSVSALFCPLRRALLPSIHHSALHALRNQPGLNPDSA